MFRFTTRDVLWLTVAAALACAWWLERRTSNRMSRERTEAIAKWQDANEKWTGATKLIPPQQSSGGGMGGGGLGGTTPAVMPPVADEDDDDDDREKSGKQVFAN